MRKHNIPSGGKKRVNRPVLKIDLNSGVILTQYPSVVEASNANKILPGSLVGRIKKNVIIDGACFVYEDEYLKQ